MTTLTTILALRIYGPCSAAELSRRLDTDRYSAIIEAEALVGTGLAEQREDGRWDITPSGRAMVDLDLRTRKRAAAVAAQATRRWPYQFGGRA